MKVSSKSVVFDPKDVKYPILKVSKITSNYCVYYYIRACKDFCEPINLSEVGVESKAWGVETGDGEGKQKSATCQPHPRLQG